jgi:hypothetical protein
MVMLGYNLGCRNCLQSDGIKRITQILDADERNYLSKTELNLVKMVETWREQEEATCDFCNSTNVEILDIDVNGEPAYDFDRLVQRTNTKGEYMLMFNIDKSLDNIRLRPGGSPKLEFHFAKTAIQTIITFIASLPTSYFKAQARGNFFISLTGSHLKVQIERFRNSGISKDEIFQALKPSLDQVGVDYRQFNLASTKSNPNTFKGSSFNSWFYAESLEEAKSKGYPYSNVCFNLDENTLVACGTGNDSPRDFIQKNLNNDFKIDSSTPAMNINGKKVLYAKRS